MLSPADEHPAKPEIFRPSTAARAPRISRNAPVCSCGLNKSTVRFFAFDIAQLVETLVECDVHGRGPRSDSRDTDAELGGCCARAAKGHAMAVLPRNLTKSRLIGSFLSASTRRVRPALTQPSPPVIQGIFAPSADKKEDRRRALPGRNGLLPPTWLVLEDVRFGDILIWTELDLAPAQGRDGKPLSLLRVKKSIHCLEREP
jgi:hypothetical protein